MRAVSVRVNEVIGVAGYVLPGNRVDILATASPTDVHSDITTKVILSNVQVVTAGTRMEQDQEKGKPMQVTVVTLLVFPDQAERLALASTEGKIQLALRNPLDTGAPETPGIKTATLMGLVKVQAPAKVVAGGKKVGWTGYAAVDGAGPADRRNHPGRQALRGSDPLTELRRTPMKPRRGSAPKILALFVYIIVILVATPQAQQPASFSGSPAISAGPAAVTTDATDIDLLVGRSTILNVGSPITRVSLTVPDVADAMVTSSQQLLIHGKTPGTISMFVWDKSGGIKTYEVNVRRDLKQLVEQVQQLFPGEPISVVGSGKDVVLSGTVTSKYVIDKAADIAGGYVDKKENVVNLLKQQEGQASNQVMLKVRFAEVSRNALQELGVNLFTGATGYKDWIARTTTQQFTAPDFTDLTRTADLNDNLTGASGKFTLSDFLNIFVFSNKYNMGSVIRALEQKGLFQSLAEPNLIAINGKEASFLAGGEYPYPVAQAGQGSTTITIQFKEFGVRLAFTPTVLGGDLINLKVKPEVSSLDFANGVSISGFRVPALSTRRTETEVELQDGQTFAIAGLMNNTVSQTMSKIPGIGDIPILGYLFKSRAYQKQQTELVVMITPVIVRKGSSGVSQGLPSIVGAVHRHAREGHAAAGPVHRFAALPGRRKAEDDQRGDAVRGARDRPGDAAASRGGREAGGESVGQRACADAERAVDVPGDRVTVRIAQRPRRKGAAARSEDAGSREAPPRGSAAGEGGTGSAQGGAGEEEPRGEANRRQESGRREACGGQESG